MLDLTFAMLRDGYDAIWKQCRTREIDHFETRVLGKPAICIHGRAAAELFYDESKLARGGAIPRRVVSTLFGEGGVQTLDDHPHRVRKQAFLAIVSETNVERLSAEMIERWRTTVRGWEARPQVQLLEESQRVLAASALAWAGLEVIDEQLAWLARDLAALVDGFGGVGPRLWRAKLARARLERFVAGQVEVFRAGEREVPAFTALAIIARHRDPGGTILSAQTAAVEILNVIRPVVAITWYIAFAALALNDHPQTREALAADRDGSYTEAFIHEVRRFYPFAPYLGAKVRVPFAWHGTAFRPGTTVLLDIYGMHHDPEIFPSAHAFYPERFVHKRPDPFTLIPQGGGDRETGHRCPGEAIVIDGMTVALHLLVHCLSYRVPAQDLSIDLRRMPTAPHSGVILSELRPLAALEGAWPRRARPEVLERRCPVAHAAVAR